MKRTTYFVRSYGGKWKVKREGADREYCVCDTKYEGIRIARKLAHEVAPAQIIIENDDGTFQQEWTHKDCSVLFEKRGQQRGK
ncbi:DUF2188 domain-containing protein [Halodesulfovibrio aestuarii]|uniref:DUF2188 domain-containing protein n=1 Tax=Halodesulfovibrio aestuarii TaxID=126333 RepID=A0A8G2CC55_9BACT|nr:DUF2188 domain-containing protein [Halodesulfovibrio aestuarii]SHJ49879.1 hypothetical protein SAMN05660830_02600 [Halodesulfovibrio aestuarii]